jgi:hypothetical protein
VVTKNWEPLLERISVMYMLEREGSVRVGAGVGHGQEEGGLMLQLEVLIGELLTVDGLATGALDQVS